MGKVLAHTIAGSRAAAMGVLLILVATGLCHAQPVTIKGKNIPLPELLQVIERQTGHYFIYFPGVLKNRPHLDVDFRQKDLKQVLDSCFSGLQLDYEFIDKIIVVHRRRSLDLERDRPLTGSVTGENGEPLEATSISIDGVPVGMTGADGSFRLPVDKQIFDLTVSYVGFLSQTITCSDKRPLTIVLKHNYEMPALIQAYSGYRGRDRLLSAGSTFNTTDELISRRVGTGYWDSIGRISGNLLAALTAKVPGLTVRQYNGVPGSDYGVLLRGRHSVFESPDPLVIVDGVSFSFNDGGIGRVGTGSAQGLSGASPLNSIPLSLIDRIEVLKDASAMAEYGAQSSNGVILVTLKKGAQGPARWNAEFSSGIDQAVQTDRLLNTRQYLTLRKEALQNDGLPVNATTLPEYFLWDTSRSSDFKKMVMGNTRFRNDARIGVSGGSDRTYYFLEGSRSYLSSVFPGCTADQRLSLYGHLHHQSTNEHLRLDGSLLFSDENNRLPIEDISRYMYLAPNAPAFHDSAGVPVWNSKGVGFQNIPALSQNEYQAGVSNFLGHAQVRYRLLPGLHLQTSLGYYRRGSRESSQLPIAGQAPSASVAGSKYSAVKTSENLQTETQINYSAAMGPGRITLLAGFSWQHQPVSYSAMAASGYTSDQLLEINGGDPLVTRNKGSVDYKYSSLFSRAIYTLHNKYVFALSGQRDASSRWSPGNQYGNFWTAGAAWIFSEEKIFGRWLSFGKLWGNAGNSGNDQIGNGIPVTPGTADVYPRVYKGLQNSNPPAFTNPGAGWEVSYSTNLGLDLGVLHDNIFLSAIAYRDWTVNMPATIVNEGLEFSLQTTNIHHAKFRWTSNLTFTIPANRLVRYSQPVVLPSASVFVAGQSLSAVNGYHYTGVDPATGLFRFKDVNGDGQLDERDKVAGGNLDPRWYGGLDQYIGLGNWNLNLLMDFRIQNGVNPYATLYRNNPPGAAGGGMLGNGPVEWLDRWQKAGDRAKLQRLTTTADPKATQALGNYLSSDAVVVNASFVRIKTLALAFRLPTRILNHWHLHNAVAYVKGQNLWTFTPYPVTDPETQNPFVLPPARTLVMGVQVGF